jgi:hypothetical protein
MIMLADIQIIQKKQLFALISSLKTSINFL